MISDNQLISVIVPVYNVKNDVEACLRSICAQSYENLEIIVVDDGSTDGSGEICDTMAKEDSRIKIYHTENNGLSAARNKGLSHCKGDYIGFIDSDDAIHEYMFEALLKEASSLQGNVIISCVITDEKKHSELSCDEIEFVTTTIHEAMEETVRGDSRGVFNCGVCNKLFSAELFSDYRFPYGRLNEDICTIIELLEKTESVAYTLYPMYFYNTGREDSITNSIRREDKDKACRAYVDRVLLYEKRCEILERNGLSELAVIDCKRAVYYSIKALSLYNYEDGTKESLVDSLNRDWHFFKSRIGFLKGLKFYLFYYSYKINVRFSRFLLKFVVDL